MTRALPSRATLRRDGTPFTTIDASNLIGRDEFACMSGFTTADLLLVTEVWALTGDELRTTTMADALAKVAESARAVGAWRVFGDQREAASMPSLLAPHHLSFREYTWTEQSKDEAVMLLRRLMRERRVVLPTDPKLRAELIAAKVRLAPSGKLSYPHMGDRASALITTAHAIAAGDLRMSGPITGLALHRPDARAEALATRAARNGAYGLPPEYGMPIGEDTRYPRRGLDVLPPGYRRGGWM